MRTICAVVLLVLFPFATSLQARAVLPPTADEMTRQASLICIGQIESISTGTEHHGNRGAWDVVTDLTARIRILHVSKGHAPAEITLKYYQGPNVPNGPIQMDLSKGERYRFFLNKSTDGSHYVGVLEGKYDDGFAAEHQH